VGETSYYYPAAVYCRERFRAGDFGDFVYGEGSYYHDMSHLYWFYQRYDQWKSVASFPPMLYPSHSIGFVLSVTAARVTHVACLGFEDHHEDEIFKKGVSRWDNTFSNETALGRTSDGGIIRINEFRRVGMRTAVRLGVYGTEACFEHQAFEREGHRASIWCTKDKVEDISDLLRCKPSPTIEEWLEAGAPRGTGYPGTAPVHPVERLPDAFQGLPNGHQGSHQFLVDDFVRACRDRRLPPVNAWVAAAYCAPGIIAHESAKRGGEMLEVPDFGQPPAELAAGNNQ
jgi:predicted dehydrogenase